MSCDLGPVPVGTVVTIAVEVEVDPGVDPREIQPAPLAGSAEADPAVVNNRSRVELRGVAVNRLVVEPPPPAKQCTSARAFKIRIRERGGKRLRGVRVTVEGRRVPVRYGKRVTAIVDLRGRAPGRYVVRIRATTASGRVLNGRRVYRTCETKLPHNRPPRL